MVAWGHCLAAISLAASCAGCAIVPDIPPDPALPMRELLSHTACELQSALKWLSQNVDRKQFDANGWTIKVSLQPKAEADITPGVGLTRKSLAKQGVTRFVSWVLGGGPGVQLDLKGTRSSGVDFAFESSELIKDTRLVCDPSSPSYHVLARHLGVGEWLYRSVQAMYVTNSASIDKPSYSSVVFIKFSGNGSHTFTFPSGTDFWSLSGYYFLEEQLNINFVAKPKTKHFTVVTLPKGGAGFDPNRPAPLIYSPAVLAAETRSDLAQIEQAIRNLQLRAQ